MKMRKIIALLIPTIFLFTACSSSSTVTNLSAAEFSTKTHETGVVTIDVRTPGEFSVGHIAGAINIDVEGLQFDSDIAKLDRATTYAVYCHSGRRSQIAVDKMSKLKFKTIYNLTSGIQSWQAAGLPLVTT